MATLIHCFKTRPLFILCLSLLFFSNSLVADDDDDYEDEEQSLYCPSRDSFLSICEEHFADNIATKDTWLEVEDTETINRFSKYLHYIPKFYEADCCHCYDCGRVRFNLYGGCTIPTDCSHALGAMNYYHKTRSMRCVNDSDHCESLCWNGAYFRLWNHRYLHFFKHFLQYCSENECDCYWPECNPAMTKINNRVYRLCKHLADEGLITPEFSPYWVAKWPKYDSFKDEEYIENYYPNSHGMASSLTTYTFFYSQYHQMLLSVAEFIDSNSIRGNPESIDHIYATLEDIRERFLELYTDCIDYHPHPKIYYERGLLRMHSGDIEDALMDVNRLMRMADRDANDDILTTELYQQEGELYADLGRYDKAISSLSEAIRLDPNNRGAYFSRAQAYFETGAFDQSLDDYLASKSNSSSQKEKLKPSSTLKESVLNGVREGCKEAVVDFVPSLCSSIYGLCSTMWIFAAHPINAAKDFVDACCDIGRYANEFRKNVEIDEIESYPIEIQRLYNGYDRLSETEKAHLVGYIVGKYGVDIFAGGTAVKGITAFKKLRVANRGCMLETMAASTTNKAVIVDTALKHKFNREAFFKNVKLHVDRQNKHIPGKHNYQPGKSIFEHPNPRGLLEKFAGTGKPGRNRIPGLPDYREKVNFKEFIGYHVHEDTGVKTATTWGEIRYSTNDGAHIVPVYPEKVGL